MKDQKLLNSLWDEVAAGRVTSSQKDRYTLFKYTQATVMENSWNSVNRQARGIIFDIDGTIKARPFSKFFNLNERPETMVDNLPWSDGFEVYEKMDGSCGIGYIDDSETWRLATPGSMASDQAVKGTEMLWEHGPLWVLPIDCTPVFEIVYPGNRIVVDYKGETFLTLLAIFEHDGTEWHPSRVDQMAELLEIRRPQLHDADVRSSELSFEDNSEGYVCRFSNGLRVKIKSPEYVRIHRILNHLSPKRVIEMIRNNEYGNVMKQLPKEIAKDFDDIRAAVQSRHSAILTIISEYFQLVMQKFPTGNPRKDLAAWVMKNVPKEFRGFVFAVVDGKDIEDKVWDMVIDEIKANEKV